jgi:hypothetical protein
MTKYIEIDGIGEIVPRSEYDALAAQVEALQSRVGVAERVEVIFSDASELSFDECKKLFPDDLLEIRAEAVSSCADKLGDAFILPYNLRKETQKAEFYKAGWRHAFLFIKQYADSIRKGGVK